jgi:hypothetical protein
MTLRRFAKNTMLATAIMTMLAALPALAEEMKVKGMITSVKGNTVTVRDSNNATQSFTISADTKFKKTKGLTGVVHDKVEAGALMPGLPVSAEVEDGIATDGVDEV